MNLFLSLLIKHLMPVAQAAEKVGFFEAMKPPVDISTTGYLIDDLFLLTTKLIIFFFVLVCIGLFGFSYKYAKKRSPKALYTHGTSKKQIAIVAAIGAAVFILIDMQITTISNKDFVNTFLNYPTEKDNYLKIEVLGQQWAWNFRYAGKDGIFNTEDDVVTLNDLRLPVGKKVVFQVSSKDVIHSLYFPNARQKVDAMPGRISRLWFELTKPGLYDIACAEMCGTFHYRMQAKLTVYSQEDYDKWLSEQEAKATIVNDIENPDMYWGWKWLPEEN